MWSSFLDTLQTQLQNQVVAGGIALGLAGILVAALRKVPGMLWAQMQRLFVATAVIDSRNDIFNAYVAKPSKADKMVSTIIQTLERDRATAANAAPLSNSSGASNTA